MESNSPEDFSEAGSREQMRAKKVTLRHAELASIADTISPTSMLETRTYPMVQDFRVTDYGRRNLRLGIVASCIGHALLFYYILFRLSPSFEDLKPIVYSVSIEGGKSLGGISQVAKNNQKAQVAPPKKISGEEKVPKVMPPPADKAREVKPVENAEVSLAEKKKPEPKKVEAKTSERKKAEEKKATPSPSATPKKARAPTAEELNKSYQQAMQRYLGESSDAGGKGFGAGALGGKSMGGGVVKPPEFFTYLNLLKGQIKKGWNWYDPNTPLTAKVSFRISPDGAISAVQIEKGSGNAEFDASVVRAINKASPLPAPPASVYQDFKYLVLVFDPRE